MSLAVISHPDCQLHDVGLGHPERPDRTKVIQSALERYPFKTPVEFLLASAATREQLIRAHDEQYVDSLFSIAPTEGLVILDEDTMMNPFSLQAALYAAGSVPQAVDLVMKGSAQAVFCNVRPPGHHAERGTAMGFCFFDNVAVGAAYAMEHYHLERIAIIDFDVHRGNGTQDIFLNDSRVLYCSSFAHPLYPGYDKEQDHPHILSVPLPLGTDGATFRGWVQDAWFAQLRAFKPQLIFFSAGFDAHAEDPMHGLRLHKADYVWLTQEVVKIARASCGGKIVSVLEGGYNLDVLAECVPAHVEALGGRGPG